MGHTACVMQLNHVEIILKVMPCLFEFKRLTRLKYFSMRCCTAAKNFMIIVVFLSSYTIVAADDRTQLPSFLQNSYFGVTGGLAHFAYTDASLEPNFHSTGISRDAFAVRLYFGHYFNPYLAAQIGFMGAIKLPQYHGVTAPHSANSVRTTFLNFTLKPT